MTFTNALRLESGKALSSNRTAALPLLSAVSFSATHHVYKAGLVVGTARSARWPAPGGNQVATCSTYRRSAAAIAFKTAWRPSSET